MRRTDVEDPDRGCGMTISLTDAVLVAVISGTFLLANTLISKRSEKRTGEAINATSAATIGAVEQKLQVAQAVTETKLEELTREVREHNGFARRMPVLEEKIAVVNHRIDDLEHKN